MKLVTILSCPVCHSANFVFLFKKCGFSIKKCGVCGLVLVNPRPSEKDLNSHYSEKFFKGEIKLPGRQTKNYLEGISSYTGRSKKLLSSLSRYQNSGTLLDIGCGLGYLIEQAKACGWKTMGLEISDFAVDICKEKRLIVKKGKIGDVKFPKNHFDVVVAQDVLEHLFDPGVFLNEVNRIMKKKGYLVLEMPNNASLRRYAKGRDWLEYIPPLHLNFFDNNTLKTILENHGFKVIKIYSEISLTLGLRERLRRFKKGRTGVSYIILTAADELITNFKKNVFYPPVNFLSKYIDIHGDLLIAYAKK
jgi:2-polyprenyl-3-methyl-5-hydroxy-6-metoxy-1,4-benzoquinol methylase